MCSEATMHEYDNFKYSCTWVIVVMKEIILCMNDEFGSWSNTLYLSHTVKGTSRGK